LNERLQKARESFAPRQKFSFKNARKVAPSSSSTPAAVLASQLPPSSSSQTVTTSHEGAIEEIPDDSGNYNATLRENTTRDIRSPSFTQATHVNLYDHQSMHIVLPISARSAMTTGSIRDIRHCIVDISVSWKDEALKNTHFATMNMTNIVDSLILTGSVKGATHVTGMRNCVIVASTGQLRMHQCEDVDVYLRCSSEPIIEHCKGMRFAPLPEHFVGSHPSINFIKPLLKILHPLLNHVLCFVSPTQLTPPSQTSNFPSLSTPNRWNQVQDFQWIKAEHSPNWSILPESERVSEEVWRDVVPGSPKIGLGEIMKVVRAGGLGVSK
jgi:hypothetical protein